MLQAKDGVGIGCLGDPIGNDLLKALRDVGEESNGVL